LVDSGKKFLEQYFETIFKIQNFFIQSVSSSKASLKKGVRIFLVREGENKNHAIFCFEAHFSRSYLQIFTRIFLL